jgi:sucrose-6-phosphate hydrolase SacC (GH32 family)
LRTTPDGIRLFQEPIDSLQNLQEQPFHLTDQTVEQLNRKLSNVGPGLPHTFKIQSTVPLGTAQEVGWKLLADDGSSTIVGYDTETRRLFVDRRHSGVVGFSREFPVRTTAPLSLPGNLLQLQMLVDRCSIEVFAGGGRIAMTNLVFPLVGAQSIQVYSKGGEPGPISLDLSQLRPIYPEKGIASF